MKIEVGKKYELNNGEVHERTHMRGSDLISVDDFGYCPFVINGILYHQDGRFAVVDADHECSVKREWTEPETGTLAELDVKPGDVVEMVWNGILEEECSVTETIDEHGSFFGRADGMGHIFRIISRASDTPKTWGEMTDAEKVEDLEQLFNKCVKGLVTEEYCNGYMEAIDHMMSRIKPEPVRETVTGWWNGHNFHNKPNYGDRTHRITFTTTDGKPDLDSIKMEEV